MGSKAIFPLKIIAMEGFMHAYAWEITHKWIYRDHSDISWRRWWLFWEGWLPWKTSAASPRRSNINLSLSISAVSLWMLTFPFSSPSSSDESQSVTAEEWKNAKNDEWGMVLKYQQWDPPPKKRRTKDSKVLLYISLKCSGGQDRGKKNTNGKYLHMC